LSDVPIIVVEDDPEFRDGLLHLLGRRGFHVVGAFESAESAVEALNEGVEPRLALVDLGLPGASGRAFVRELRALKPDVDAVVLTSFDDDDNVFEALRAGASGYLLKTSRPDEIAAALQEVLAGGAPMSPAIARRVVRSFSPQAAVVSPLTNRETEVLNLLVKGVSYPQIGEVLGISTNTVREHIKKTYRKLEVASKAEAAVEATRRGLL
jgi:DNA-binding NarL/FixJ family response regulator